MSGNHSWAGFEKLLMDESVIRFERFGADLKDRLRDILGQELFGDGEHAGINPDPTKDEAYFSQIFANYREVDACVERLSDVSVYIGSYPYRSVELDKNRYLRYHIENYFHEIYILRERLTAFLKRVGRGFREDRRHSSVLAATRPLFPMVTDSLKGVANTRNAHVHRIRFDAADLTRLDTLQLISRIYELKEDAAEFYDIEYRATRAEWKSRLQSNNDEVGKLLDSIAERLVPLMFDEKRRRLKYPRRTAT